MPARPDEERILPSAPAGPLCRAKGAPPPEPEPAPISPRPAAPVVVSACLLGRCCRYDGRTFQSDELVRLAREGAVIPVCPEEAGGLSTPRPPAAIEGAADGAAVLDGRARVLTNANEDVTAAYLSGACRAAVEAVRAGAGIAYLKARSPSCGAGQLSDPASPSGCRPGNGAFAELLLRLGVRVVAAEPDRAPGDAEE